MSNIRSNLPSRLRQLMSETEIGASVNFGYKPSPSINAFIEEVIQCPLQDIAIPLSGFQWQYGKGYFHHWRPLFLHFDTYFKTYVSCRKELLLSNDILSDAIPFPKKEVLQILRVMQIIFENCHNKSSFVGLEHFKLLLASTDPEIIIEALETLAALVKIIPSKLHASGKLVECGSLNSILMSLAQGWGSKEGGLGLFSCISLNEKTKDDGLRLFPSEIQNGSEILQVRVGSTLYFELHGMTPSGTSVIHIPDLQLRKENDLSLMKICIEQYNVPLELRFSLLTKIRYARAFHSSSVCRLYSKICLLAFIVLVQSSDSNDELVSFFGNEPEYMNELIKIVSSEETIPDGLRTLAMTALGAQLAAHSVSHDRARVLSGSSIGFNGGNRMVLQNVLQRAIFSLKVLSDMSSVAFVEAFLHFYLFHVIIISSSSTGNVFRGFGIVSSFLPLLDDSDSTPLHLVCLVVKNLQKVMDYSSTSLTPLRDLGVVEQLVHRLQIEVHQVIDNGGKDNSIATQKRLIRALLKALGSATRAITNSTGSQYSNEVSLAPTVSIIFSNKEQFGGEIYAAAVTLMNEMIYKDPTCFNTLYDLGLPTTFLSSVVSGAIASPKAIACIPSGLGAICLNAKGLKAVKESNALSFLFNVFTEQKYVMAMNDCIGPMVNNAEELLRHVTSLRSIGVDQMIKIIHKVESLGETMCNQLAEKVQGTDAMEMDSIKSKDKENFGAGDSSDKSMSTEQFMQLLIFHVIVLLHRTLKKTETCRLFVEKVGIEALLKLLLRPSIIQSSDGIPIALYSTVVFKCLMQHHSTLLARAFCSALKDHVKKALTELTAISGCFLLDTSINPDTKIFSSLSLVEFLLFLAVSKDDSWVTALVTEFGNDNKNVLEDIGRIHREIMWQVALLEDTKVDRENGLSGSTDSTYRHTESSVHDDRNPRINFFRQNVTSQNQSTSELIAKKDAENKKSCHKSACDMVQSLSIHITRLFQELGKVMLLPSRRSLIVSPASKSVASTFASISMDHMIYVGRSGSETFVTTKCRYSGKVAEFIDDILLEKPDSCNPVILNCLYGKGAIHLVLTTFEATTQVTFAVNRSPASPIETNEADHNEIEGELLYIDGPSASYGKLIDHLATSSFLLSPLTKHLLTQPIVSGEIAFPRDAEKFVKTIQSMVLKAVLPVWSHPQFPERSHEFVSTIINIIRHILSGVEMKNVASNIADRVAGPPPSETTISTIVEMGFCRHRAEEALRQVGSNSVELAMEWLFSHPEEVHEDDEFARALTMSMGNSGADTKKDVTTVASDSVEEEQVDVFPVAELLSACKKIVLTNDTLAFSVRDLLVMICSKNEGHERPKVLSFIIEQVKLCGNELGSVNQNMLSAFLHVLALILDKDVDARELAAKSDLVKVTADLLSLWISDPNDLEASQVPKWVTSAFVAVDRLAQVDTSLYANLEELLKKNNQVSDQTSLVNDEDKQRLMDLEEQKRLIDVACGCLKKRLPSETTHAILQLCVTLTRMHSVAVSFLDAGGLHLLLSLSVSSLFVGFDILTASIIWNILEDSHTLQQAMESKIKQTVATAARSGRLTARNFLLSSISLVKRDPVIFMKAAKVVCQVEMVGDKPYIVLMKDRVKDKSKEKDIVDEKEKLDANSRSSKIHRKPPQSFVNVIDILLDSVLSFVPTPPEDESINEIDSSSKSCMEIAVSVSMGKGKDIVTLSEDKEAAKSHESSLSMSKVVLILELLTEILLTYGSSVNILVRKDAFCGIFHHVLHQFLPYSKTHKKEIKSEVDYRHRLASRSNQFLVASCVRSTEARKRIFTIIGNVFNDFVDSPNGFRAPRVHIQSHIELLNGVLTARFPTGSCISGEASLTFTQAGLVQSFTRMLQVLDLDHADSPKVTNGILKVLELVTKEHIHTFESKNGKHERLVKPSENSQHREDSGVNTTQPLYASIQSNENAMAADRTESFSTVNYGGSENILDMEHDQDIEEDGFNAFDYMEENGQGELNGDDMSDEADEDGDDGEHNDIEEDIGHHHLPLEPNMDRDDDHEIDEDEFDEEVMEVDEDSEYDENMFDHIEVLDRGAVASDGFHVMPVEIFGSSGPGRTTSIYDLLGRSGDSSATPQHPFLVEPPSLSDLSRLSGTDHDEHSARNLGNSVSQLNALFRSLRNGRQGHIFNLLANESQPSGRSSSSAIPQGLEDLLILSLRRPQAEKASNNTTLTESQNVTEVDPSSEFFENQENNASPPAILYTLRGDDITPAFNESIHGTSSRQAQSVEIRDGNNDVVSDVEAVSRNSRGSGTNLDRSLRSLDVEIGTADGHDDGDARTRRAHVSVRDASLDSVTEVAEDPIREGDQGEEQQNNGEADSIDPAFLDTLPEELRAEVLSGQQNEPQQQHQNPEPQNNEEIDPEFLAALPPNIREEVLAQQRAQRRVQSNESEAQPVEMDTDSIIATFPSHIREEVLLTSSDDVLASLTPALVAEANMLREQMANRFNQPQFGIHPRGRIVESSRREDFWDRFGSVLSRRSVSIKHAEAEGSPLVDKEGLKALIRLLHVVQPIYKNEHKLLLNTCAHAESRIDLLKILMELLMLDKRKCSSDLNALEYPYKMYGSQSHVTHSHPQCVNGVPPLVSRRVLDTLTYLARNHPLVGKLLLEFRLPKYSKNQSPISSDKRGKAIMVVDEDVIDPGQTSFTLLLSLLNQSLYLRSIAHLEQLLNLLNVVINNVENQSNSSDAPRSSASEQQSGPPISTRVTEMNVVSAATLGEGDVTMGASSFGSDKDQNTIRDSNVIMDASSSGSVKYQNALIVMNDLPKPELQLLCSLLAHDGLSYNAYTLVAKLLRKLVVIAPIHCHLFISELSGSVQSLIKSATGELQTFGDVGKSLLSSLATHGAPVLRVIQALSSLVDSLGDKDKKPDIAKKNTAIISLVRNINIALEPLWQELSNCIAKVENFSKMLPDPSPASVKPSGSVLPPAGTHNVLPFIESFFITCDKLHHDVGSTAVSDVDEASTSSNLQKAYMPGVKVDEKAVRFLEKHRKLLNTFIRYNPGLLEKSFSLMLKLPRFIDFDNKRSHFRSKIKHQHDRDHSSLRISVRRAYILEDSYNRIRTRPAKDLKRRLTVHFQGEEGIDAGGLTREWYQVLSRVVFDKGALLFTTVGNESTFQPNPNSVYQTEHLSYFKFVGRVVGKVLFDEQLLDVHFTRSFYKHILGVKVTYHDIEAIDPDYFKNLKWLLENDISDMLDLTFSIDADEEKLILYERTEVTDYELIPGGRNIRVTEENKHRYVDLVAEHRLTTAIRPQINAFMDGFNEVISRDLISIFNDKELELLISGLPDIDLDDLRVNTEYFGYNSDSPAIQWFWEVVQGFSEEDKARLLQFVTGTSKVPLEGFSALQGISGSQKFQIHKAYGSVNHLPSAHTCFNQLDLPEYPCKQRLEERLLLAIHEANEGFGFS